MAGARFSLLKGKSLSDVSLHELSEILMETMLDKITGKKRPEGDETTTEKPSAVHGPSVSSQQETANGDEKADQLQNELENSQKPMS